VGRVCAIDPEITFTGRFFIFTGDSTRCKRETLWGHVSALGGTPSDIVTKHTNYLVVCDCGSPHWAFSCFARSKRPT
jgi:NAD-dependent DNA ligase